LQSEIILNCVFGAGVSKKQVIVENADGTKEKQPIITAFNSCTEACVERSFWPF